MTLRYLLNKRSIIFILQMVFTLIVWVLVVCMVGRMVSYQPTKESMLGEMP